MARLSLPPGFRFHPTDVELILYFLKKKVMGKKLHIDAIAQIDIYKFVPSDLPEKSCLQSRDLEWYFFCPQNKRYNSGSRASRATDEGFWKTTGKDRAIYHNNRIVGMKKTLIFHFGRAPNATRTNWVIHEYRLVDKQLANRGFSLDSLVLCKLYEKSGLGPKNGEQHGAPFQEDDWESETDNDPAVQGPDSTSHNRAFSDHSSLLVPILPQNARSSRIQTTEPIFSECETPGPALAPEVSVDDLDVEKMLYNILYDDDDCTLQAPLQMCGPSTAHKITCKEADAYDDHEIFNGLTRLDSPQKSHGVGLTEYELQEALLLLDPEPGMTIGKPYLESNDFMLPFVGMPSKMAKMSTDVVDASCDRASSSTMTSGTKALCGANSWNFHWPSNSD